MIAYAHTISQNLFHPVIAGASNPGTPRETRRKTVGIIDTQGASRGARRKTVGREASQARPKPRAPRKLGTDAQPPRRLGGAHGTSRGTTWRPCVFHAS